MPAEFTATDYIYGYDTTLAKGFVKSQAGEVLKEWDGLAPVGYFDPHDFLFCNRLAILSAEAFVKDRRKSVSFLMDTAFNILPGGPYDDVSREMYRKYLGVQKDGNLGYVDCKGQWKIPLVFNVVYGDSDEAIWPFLFVEKSGLWGVLGPDLEEVLPAAFLEIDLIETSSLPPLGSFTDDGMPTSFGSYACVCRVKGVNGKYGVLSLCQNEGQHHSEMAFTGCVYAIDESESDLEISMRYSERDGLPVSLQFDLFWKIEEWKSEDSQVREVWELKPVG